MVSYAYISACLRVELPLDGARVGLVRAKLDFLVGNGRTPDFQPGAGAGAKGKLTTLAATGGARGPAGDGANVFRSTEGVSVEEEMDRSMACEPR